VGSVRVVAVDVVDDESISTNGNAISSMTSSRRPQQLGCWLGRICWIHACIFSFLVASVIDNKPVLSIIMSVVVSTALLALLYEPLRSGWGEAASMPSTSQPDS
jgi:hypothetical protein